MTGAAETTLVVNGLTMTFSVDPESPLISVLRDDLGLMGVRAGCGQGFCGSCTVLSDGDPILACSTPLSAVAGRQITTPEGLGTPERPHAVQAAFIDEQAAQCGYCINGVIMSVVGTAGAGTDLTPAWLDEHHLCRCGTHSRILRAVEAASTAATAGDEDRDAPDAVDEVSARNGMRGPQWSILPEHGEAITLTSLSTDPARLESWLQLLPDGRVAALTGRVEFGQGIRTAMGQIVAAQLGVAPELVVVVPATTSVSADEKYTSGSNSVDTGGAALGAAAVAFARALRARAAKLLGADSVRVRIRADGHAVVGKQIVSFADLAVAGPLRGRIRDDDSPDWTLAPLRSPRDREDLLPKLTGAAAYVQDLRLSGMAHARALLPPSYDAKLLHLEPDAVEAMPGVLRVLVDGRLIIVLADREDQAIRALRRLEREARWQVPDWGVDSRTLADHYRHLDAQPYVAASMDPPAPPGASHTASFSVPYQAHAAIAPSCAVAHQRDDQLLVFTHSQGVYPLRRSLAALLDIETDRLTVAHRDGPGTYGHNLADDAAAFAGLAARALPGRPIRFQFTMQDEFRWEPFGPAMMIDIEATLDGTGAIRSWRHHGVTDTHTSRPQGDADRLFASWLRRDALERPWPGPHEGGARNAVPLYVLPAVEVVVDHVRGPLRTSALRTLGAFANTFASESFLDELAEKAHRDPLEFRLEHLEDRRAKQVLRTVAAAAAWKPKVGPSGRGRGLALSRYKNRKAYVAAVADVRVDPQTAGIRVERLVLACDAGAVVNPDGLRNQLEGGALQALSRVLYEEVTFDRSGITSLDWSTYPVLGFEAVPDLEIHLLEDSPHPPLGVGEASLGPVAAAVANAIDDAIGVRLRELPLTPKRVTDRLHGLTGHEVDRVRLR